MGLKYAVVGTGALGCFYGGMLAKAGNDVHFLFNSDYEFVKQNGLKVDTVLGNFMLNNVNAYSNSNQMPACDVVLVCLKTTNNFLLKNILPPLLHSSTHVILVQNGFNIEEQLAETFINQPIAGALAFICSTKIGKGHVLHSDYGKITVGCHKNCDSKIIENVIFDFDKAQVPAEFTSNLLKSRWKKLVWNIPFNGLCVALNTTTEKLLNNKSACSLVYNIMLEVVRAANACGVKIDEQFAYTMLESTKAMKPYAPSMKVDFDNKRKLEIDAIYTKPIEHARANGFVMPKVEMLEKQLVFIENSYLG